MVHPRPRPFLRGGQKPRVELLCVGTELLMGKLNTHGAYFSAWLEGRGLPLARETTVSDDPVEMEALFREVRRRADVILVTGGLGPTFDDLTRDAWSRVTGRPLVLRRDLLDGLKARFRQRGIPMPPANRRQAYILKGAQVLPNAYGTAPGQLLEMGEKALVLLPGPGREMKPMVEGDLARFFQDRFGEEGRKTRVWRLFGRPESFVDDILRRRVFPRVGRGVVWGIFAQGPVVDIKATVAGADESRSEHRLAALDRLIMRLFGKAVFGAEADVLEKVTGDRLRRSHSTLATAESCTGGLLAQKITSVPGSSEYYWGGIVSYANQAKQRLAGVRLKTLARWGAVSSQTARELALNVQRLAGTDYGLSITGVAGPSGGSVKKPVGLIFIGLATPRGTRVWSKTFQGGRDWIREQSALWALDALRLSVKKKGFFPGGPGR